MIVVGVDPGYDRLGIAVLEKKDELKVLFSCCAETDKKQKFQDRVFKLGTLLNKTIKKWEPDSLAVEKLFIHKNKKTASRVSEIRGVIIYIAASNNIPVYEYTPLEIKSLVTGYGRADKIQVSNMVEKSVKISKKARHDDEFDAIATALTHIYKASTVYPHK